ncbi:MAG: arylsulfatase [Chloroflexi bacterium]|nr:arylsulfatase [Chloroflexota bacterium]
MTQPKRPNIVLIMADDMGFSDIQPYGGEIRTPNLNAMAGEGLSFSQMYNNAKCCPSRASLMTGLYPHQAGIGYMTDPLGVPSYQGYLNKTSVTVAEVLKDSGYATYMSGKWHVGGGYALRKSEGWTPGDETHPTPTQRGFDKFYGTLTGAGNYFNPQTLMSGDSFIEVETDEYHYTDAISDEAARMVREASNDDKPFFLYVAYTAPHWPLHAYEEDIAHYRGKYMDGWDPMRTARHEELKSRGILDEKSDISPRDESSYPWEDEKEKEWEDLRMAVYAAQIEQMDRGIGRVLDALKETGVEDDTLVMFLSDNGACEVFLAEDSRVPTPALFGGETRGGEQIKVGNFTGQEPGGEETFMSYDLPWANASNAPFRFYKNWIHDGGISTPFIVKWPSAIQAASNVHTPTHITDIPATCIAAAGASYPSQHADHDITPLEGESFLDLLNGENWQREAPMFWEHEGNRGMRMGDWKLVSEFPRWAPEDAPGRWELYNLESDRTELIDLSVSEPERLTRMSRMYDEWAERCGVKQWPLNEGDMRNNVKGRNWHINGLRFGSGK